MKLLGAFVYNETHDLKAAVGYAEELISIAQRTENNKYLYAGYFLKGTKERLLGNLDEALDAFFKSAEMAQKIKDLKREGDAYGAIADTYSVANNHPNAKLYYTKAISILRQSTDSTRLASTLFNYGDELRKIQSSDSALLYFKEAKQIFGKLEDTSKIGYCLGGIGMVYANTNKNEQAKTNLSQAIKILEAAEDDYPIADYLLSLADVHLREGNKQVALADVTRSLHLAEQHELKEQIRDANLKISEIFESIGNMSEALKHYKRYVSYRDSIVNEQSKYNMAIQRFDYEINQKQVEVDKATQKATVESQKAQAEKNLRIYLSIILGLTIIILFVLFNANQNKQKAYKVLNLQKQETDRQRAKAEETLSELQQTQRQLIQTAKMASLGELTAGIAHEIQNPLNFVNNFSEVSVEMLNELREGTANKLTATDKTEANQLINELADNLKKISDHGKRADAIVKGMLHHSRVSTGKKEPVDINALADEYLRLSYHGLRAKDKAFNANFTENFDDSIGKIEAVGQDIGRVLLNLYNNAFYAVNEKKQNGDGAFEPLVAVTTKKIGNKVEISVKDNGTGIPQKLHDKIFQPFFTTKPTGQGTGLGLSLSYDIIKAHGGEFKMETEEGLFTNFIIQLPLGNNGAVA